MKKAHSIYLVLICFLISCRDKEAIEFSENQLSGTLYYTNTLNGFSDKIILPNTTVYLTDDTLKSYILSVNTDSAGNFIFTHIPKQNNKKYYIYAETVINNLYYKSYKEINTGNTNDLILLPKNSGLSILVKDINGNPVPNAIVCLFVNEQLRNSKDTSKAAFSKNTNITGTTYFDNLNTGLTYYFYVEASLNNKTYLDTTFQYTYSYSPFTKDTIIVINEIAAQNSDKINILVVDDNNKMPINSIKLFTFGNRLLAIEDTVNKNGAGSILSTITDLFGRTTISGLVNGKYYFTIHDSIGSIKFNAFDSIDYIAQTSPSIDTIFAKKQ